MVDLVNNFLSQQLVNIFRILPMIRKKWFTILITNIMPNSIVVLTNMLKIAYYSTDLTYNLNHILTLYISRVDQNGRF